MRREDRELAAIGADVYDCPKVATERDRLVLHRGDNTVQYGSAILRLSQNSEQLAGPSEIPCERCQLSPSARWWPRPSPGAAARACEKNIARLYAGQMRLRIHAEAASGDESHRLDNFVGNWPTRRVAVA
jgi:hypothetical protein